MLASPDECVEHPILSVNAAGVSSSFSAIVGFTGSNWSC